MAYHGEMVAGKRQGKSQNGRDAKGIQGKLPFGVPDVDRQACRKNRIARGKKNELRLPEVRAKELAVGDEKVRWHPYQPDKANTPKRDYSSRESPQEYWTKIRRQAQQRNLAKLRSLPSLDGVPSHKLVSIVSLHSHNAYKLVKGPFVGPVNPPSASNPKSYGGFCETHFCHCGATKMVNIKDKEKETGRWKGGKTQEAIRKLVLKGKCPAWLTREMKKRFGSIQEACKQVERLYGQKLPAPPPPMLPPEAPLREDMSDLISLIKINQDRPVNLTTISKALRNLHKELKKDHPTDKAKEILSEIVLVVPIRTHAKKYWSVLTENEVVDEKLEKRSDHEGESRKSNQNGYPVVYFNGKKYNEIGKLNLAIGMIWIGKNGQPIRHRKSDKRDQFWMDDLRFERAMADGTNEKLIQISDRIEEVFSKYSSKYVTIPEKEKGI
jgi:hypothetical protein